MGSSLSFIYRSHKENKCRFIVILYRCIETNFLLSSIDAHKQKNEDDDE
jgi:hypothetical protein